MANFFQKEPLEKPKETLGQAGGYVHPDSLPRNLSSSLFEQVSLKSLRFIREEGHRSELAEQRVSARSYCLSLLVFGIGTLYHISQ